MQLEIEHRNALLSSLEDAQNKRDLSQRCLEDAKAKGEKEMVQWHEVEHWQALTTIEMLKKAIAQNEIDY